MKITVEMLREKNACIGQLYLFTVLFPEGVEPTIELARKHADDFNWGWAADAFLNDSSYEVFEAIDDLALREFRRECPINDVDCDAIRGQRVTDYNAFHSQCVTNYHIKIAETFVRLFNQGAKS
jgi:hypothetical protein